LAREERRNKKKEKGKKEENGKAGPSNKPANPPSAPKKTAVWVTNLPPNTTLSTLASVFSKAGVLLIGDDGEPRIKMYYDDDGKFKGEALVMYFKEGSVDLAITLLDDTELEMGAGFGNMRVRVADYEKSQTGNVPAKESGKKDENEIKDAAEKKRKPPTAEEKLRMSKRIRKMQECVRDSACEEPADTSGNLLGIPILIRMTTARQQEEHPNPERTGTTAL
jgi:HIV Tat-specific factor 1